MKIAFLGFGEAAQAFVKGWSNAGHSFELCAYDKKTDLGGANAASKREDYSRCEVDGKDTMATAFSDADIVFSVVTADQANVAAESVAPFLSPNTWFFDCNSCAPETKLKSCQVIENAACGYVDVAVMAPVHPTLHKTPLLISGPRADGALDAFRQLEMEAVVVGPQVGTASAMKLSRSIMVKGLEALTAECLLTAKSFGVEDYVLDSLEKSHPGFGWRQRGEQALERMAVHGIRRAAEMDEAANMIDSLGLPNRMTRQTVIWQNEIGNLGMSDRARQPDLAAALLDKFLSDGES